MRAMECVYMECSKTSEPKNLRERERGREGERERDREELDLAEGQRKSQMVDPLSWSLLLGFVE